MHTHTYMHIHIYLIYLYNPTVGPCRAPLGLSSPTCRTAVGFRDVIAIPRRRIRKGGIEQITCLSDLKVT